MKKIIDRADGCAALLATMNSTRAADTRRILFASVITESGAWFSKRCSLSWKLRETATKRHFVKLLAGKDKSIYPTPLAADGDRTGEIVNSRRKIRKSGYCGSSNLVDMARSGLLPTPTTGSNRNSRSTVLKVGATHTNHGVALGLTQVIEIGMGILPKEFSSWAEVPVFYKLLPTPTTREYKGGRSPEGLKAAGRAATNSLSDYLNAVAGKACKLNPLFVCEMMGFPADWTLKPFKKIRL